MYTLIKGQSSNNYHDEVIQNILELQDTYNLSEIYENEDNLYIFDVLHELKQELGYIRLENVVYYKFLEKNDPDLFTKMIKPPTKKIPRVSFVAFLRNSSADTRISRTSIRNYSYYDSKMLSSSSELDTGKRENRVNLLVKQELTEKLILEIEQRIKRDASSSRQQLRNHKAQLALQNIEIEDLQGTIRSFENIVVNAEQIGRPKAVKIPTERFTRYCFSWMKNAQAFISTIRVKTSAVREHIHLQKAALVKKLDMRDFVMPIDIQQMQIIKNLYEKEIDEQNMQYVGLKNKTTSTSLAVALQKQSLVATEKKLSDLKRNIAFTQIEVDKVQQEIQDAKKEVIASNERVMQFNKYIDEYESPTIHDYMSLKEKLALIEREERNIQRENHVLKMKLDSYKAKLELRSSQMK